MPCFFKVNCYYETKGNAIKRWNFYKGDYTEIDFDWKTTLSEKEPDTSFELFLKASRDRKRNVYQNVAVKLGTKQKKQLPTIGRNDYSGNKT